jgi:hypothetical protein
MEKLRVRLEKTHPPTILFRGDIAALEALLRKYFSFIDITVSHYRLNSATELEELGTTVPWASDFTIEAYGEQGSTGSVIPQITVSIRSFQSSVSIRDSDNPVEYKAFSEVNDFLERHKEIRAKLGYVSKNGGLYAALLSTFMWIAVMTDWKTRWLLGLKLIVVIPLLILATHFYLVSYSSRAGVWLSEEKARPGFLQRNKDDFAKDVVKCLVAAALGYALKWLLG